MLPLSSKQKEISTQAPANLASGLISSTGGKKKNSNTFFMNKNLLVCCEKQFEEKVWTPGACCWCWWAKEEALGDHFKVWTLNYNHAEPVLFGGKIFFLSGKYWLALREADAKAGKWMTWQFQILVSKSLWSVISSKRRSLDVLLG